MHLTYYKFHFTVIFPTKPCQIRYTPRQPVQHSALYMAVNQYLLNLRLMQQPWFQTVPHVLANQFKTT